MKISPYPGYKNSAGEWLDSYPSRWTALPLKRWVKIKITDGPHETPELVDDGIDFISAEAVQDGHINFDARRGFISEDVHREYCKKCYPRKGDILLCKSGATTGKMAFVHDSREFSIWSPLAQIRADEQKIFNRFLFLALQADYVQNQIKRTWSAGTQPNIAMGAIERLFIVAPPIEHQYTIANFLDRETARIDALIEKKQRQIELLQEKRRALISHAVTKGLDPNVKMKDSGVEWLGKIPEHWESKRLKFLVEVRGRIGFRGYTTTDLVNEGEGALTIGGKHIDQDCRLDLSQPEYLSWEKYNESPEIMVSKGDLLIAQRGSLGKVAIVETDIGPATINPSLVLLTRPQISVKYLFYWLNSAITKSVVEKITSATAVPMISQEQIENLHVVYPPDSEADKIVQYLNEESAKLELLIAKVRMSIERSAEYRVALISSTLTGKIDVREEAA